MHALVDRLSKALFFLSQHLFNLRIRDFRIGFTHFDSDSASKLSEESTASAELVTVTDCTTADTTQNVRTTFVTRNDAVSHGECASADVVGDHLQGRIVKIDVRCTGFFHSGLSGTEQVLEEVDVVVRVHALQHGSDTFQTHTRVNGGLRKLMHHAGFVAVKLHEHVVPNFDETVTVFIRASRRTTGDFRTVVVEDFGARTARTRIAHHPEIVGHVTTALVVTDANDAFSGHTDFVVPNVVGFVVFSVNRHRELFGRQLEVFGQKFPSVLDCIALEVVTEAEVTQHFEERVVTSRVTDVVQVVVLTAGTDTLLSRRCTRVSALVKTQEHVLELVHTSIREQKRRVITRDHGAGMHNRVTFALEELQEGLTNLRSLHTEYLLNVS